jgi:hypothetical protein
MRKKCLYFWISIVFTTTLQAQSEAVANNFIVNFSPLALADVFDGASLRVGVEVRLHRNIALALEGGYYLTYLKATKINPHGYLFRPSIKRYLNGQNCSGKYIALEYQYKNQEYDFRDSIVVNTSHFEKQYAMTRKVHSLVFKYGNLKNIRKHLVLEWYCGVGIRYIRSYSDLTPEEEGGILTGEEGDCPIQEDFIRLTGTRIFPDFHAGIKIGYKIH